MEVRYVCISKTPKPPTHPAPHKKGGNIKEKEPNKRASDPRAKFVQQHAPCSATFFNSLPYFFPSFHSHSTTIDDAKKKSLKSLKYDRNAPLRRPRSLDSTEAVLQIGGFFLKCSRGIFDFCSTKPIYLSGETLSRWRGGYCISPGSPAQNTFL